MGKAVLISIQPQWCELIASGKKSVEVRKTKPNINTPFKVYKKYDKMMDLGFKLPFMIELSLKLMNLNLIDHIYLDKEKLVNDLWK